ncbi:MAG: peptidase [Deltaproteobacteria bacterium]|nr:peptidase [Deltaproteobacteria bacterium]
MRFRIVLGGVLLFVGACQSAQTPTPPKMVAAKQTDRSEAILPKLKVSQDVATRLAQFAPIDLDFDDKSLSTRERAVLRKLVEAGQVIDSIFADQVHGKNKVLRQQLLKQGAPKEAVAYFDLMYGPWDRLRGDEPFVGELQKPKGAGYYPADLTKHELEAWIGKNPAEEKAFRSYFTVIRRQGDKLQAQPYSVAYRDRLTRAAKLLDEAAELADHPALKRFLSLRAKAFLSNDYRDSDMAWMDLGDSPIEVVIGPYEVYEDKLMGYKAAFEAFVTLRDQPYSDKLSKLASFNDRLEKNLPLAKKHLTKRGSDSPISVVNELFTAGDTRAAVQTAAFNLPNDEVVREKKGSKKVMLKNVIEAKFQKVLLPIASKLLDKRQLAQLDFDAYFTEILLHELAHGMGPGKLIKNGKPTDVNRELKEIYPSIEECKADIVGLHNGAYLAKRGGLDPRLYQQLPVAYVAGVFRAVRFGTEEAHAKAVLLGFNFLREKGAISYDAKTETFAAAAPARFFRGVRDLARELLMVQAKGDYAAAKALLDKYGKPSAEMTAALSKLSDVPVDILPRYAILEKMRGW